MKNFGQLFFSDAEAGEPTREVIEVLLDRIEMNPFQPRKTFTEEGLGELCSSIMEFGIIQPLLVRKIGEHFELIAGERRLRAAKMAGLKSVPCVTRSADDKEMAEIALIENLQREDLHFFEEATGYEKLLHQFSLTQEQLAKRVGKDQSTVANKLRLLKLKPAVRDLLSKEQLTERHARALLKVETEERQLALLQAVVEKKLNVRDTEQLVEDEINQKAPDKQEQPRQMMLRIIKDIRIFVNTIGQLANEMKKVGLDVKMEQIQDDESITITLVVPKRK